MAGPNYTLNAGDFPLHQLSDPTDRNSEVLFDTNDRVSSQGVFLTDFVSWQLGLIDNCEDVADPVFNVAGVNVRRVEPRNTPTTINAVFNHRNFWDGRANAFFNGLDPSGPRVYQNDPDAGLIEATGAAIRFRACQPDGNQEAIERMIMGDNGVAIYDGGFYNIGVRPTFEDLGLGNGDLPFSRQVTNPATGLVDILPPGVELVGQVQGPDGLNIGEGDPLFCFDPCNFEVDLAGNPRFLPDGTENPDFQCDPPMEGERIAVDGAMKVATIRNVELTAPYFHNGGEASLEDVVEFYDRGGNRRNANRDECPDVDPDPNNVDNGDTSGFAENCSNLDPDIVRLNFEPIEEEALVAFMKALTDERVRMEQAPFDHPELRIPNGHPGDQFMVSDSDGDGVADDAFVTIPAVGAGGRAVAPNDFGDLLADPTLSP